jgi:cation:H+ antiporter
MNLIFTIFVLLFTSVIIYYVGNIFAQSSSRIGDYLKLSKSVKGATLDAIASSLPELMVGLFAVIFFGQFEVGIATITGSALFNLLVIPGLAVLVSPVLFKVSTEVIHRDAIFYIMSVFLLLIATMYFQTWSLGIAVLLIAGYLFYVRNILIDTKKFQAKACPNLGKEVVLKQELFTSGWTIIAIGVATYFLTEASIHLAEILKVSPIIIAFTITAAATSEPDTVISIANARKGDIDDATSNVFGSNIFDICIGLGVPLLIYSLAKGPLVIDFDHIEVILGLLGSTILTLLFFAEGQCLYKKEGLILLSLYGGFVGYIIWLAIA